VSRVNVMKQQSAPFITLFKTLLNDLFKKMTPEEQRKFRQELVSEARARRARVAAARKV